MQDFLSAAAFAIMLSLSFGPVAFLILRRSITSGVVSAVPGALGAAVADVFFATVAFSGVHSIKAFLLANDRLLTWIAIVYLFYLGAITFRKSASSAQVKCAAGFIPIFLLTLTSPLTIVAISSYIITRGAVLEGDGLFLSLVGFFIGSFLGQMVYAGGGSLVRSKLADKSQVGLINRISGGLLVGFAAWQSLRVLSGE